MQTPLCHQQTTLLHISNNKTCWFSPLTLVLPSCSLLANAPYFVSQRAQGIHTKYHPTYWNGNATVPRNRLSFSSSRLVLREYPSSTSTSLRRCFLHNGMQVPLKILNACFNTNEAQPYPKGIRFQVSYRPVLCIYTGLEPSLAALQSVLNVVIASTCVITVIYIF